MWSGDKSSLPPKEPLSCPQGEKNLLTPSINVTHSPSSSLPGVNKTKRKQKTRLKTKSLSKGFVTQNWTFDRLLLTQLEALVTFLNSAKLFGSVSHTCKGTLWWVWKVPVLWANVTAWLLFMMLKWMFWQKMWHPCLHFQSNETSGTWMTAYQQDRHNFGFFKAHGYYRFQLSFSLCNSKTVTGVKIATRVYIGIRVRSK